MTERLLEETISKIRPADEEGREAVRAKLDELGSYAQGLGMLRDLLLRYAGMAGEEAREKPKKCTIICCADHGVAKMQVSAYPPETTVQMTENYLISQGGAANALSNFAGSDLLVADLGIAVPTEHLPGLIQRKIAMGTANSAEGPAMTREQARQALETGISFAKTCSENGYRCFLPGEMGIANTTSSAAIVAAICRLSPERATGRGTNISDERLKLKIGVVRQILQVNQPNPADGLDVLSKVGGFELGCIAGIILGAAAHRALVILDGFNTSAAALIAYTLCPAVRDYLMPSHLAAEPAHRAALEILGLRPFMDMRFRLGEAIGSSIAANLLDAAIHAFHHLGQPEEKQVDDGAAFLHEAMPEEGVSATDKTFDFYLATLPALDRSAMKACQLRIDNLAKPIYSLGYLEQIAVEMAGILADERPDTDIGRALLCFADSKLSPQQSQLTAAFAEHAEAEVTIAHLCAGRPSAEAFDFGRVTAEEITLSSSILGVALVEDSPTDACGTKSGILRSALCDGEGNPRYAAEEFLRHVPKKLKADVSALMGAMIAAAHNSALVVLDDESTEIVARYAEMLCPEIKPYILHTQPALLDLGMTVGGGCIACLGMKVIDAALYMLNDMKTFAEASVAVANDGPGAGRQMA